MHLELPAEYAESSLAWKDQALVEALKVSSKAMGDKGVQQLVEKEHREMTSRSSQSSGIARRRWDKKIEADEILANQYHHLMRMF